MNTLIRNAEPSVERIVLCERYPVQACLSVDSTQTKTSQDSKKLQDTASSCHRAKHNMTSEPAVQCTWYEVATQCVSASLWLGLLVFAPLMAGIALY